MAASAASAIPRAQSHHSGIAMGPRMSRMSSVGTGDASATEYGTPGLAALGSNAELVYEGTNNKYYHGVYSGSAWGAANDPVGGSGSMQDYGPTLPAAAVVGELEAGVAGHIRVVAS